MIKPAPFGRRGVEARAAAPASAAPRSLEVALTAEQRAYLFDGAAPAEAGGAQNTAEGAPAYSRAAGFIACLAVTAIVAGLTLAGKPHDSVAALPPELEPAAKSLFQQAGAWFTPLTLTWSIFIIASNLAANLWITRKFCAWRGLPGVPAFAVTGALASVAVAYATALIGLGESELGYVLEAASGGGAAALYRMLAGQRSFQ